MDKPVLTVSSASPKKGENVTFACITTSSDNVITYKWYLNNKQIGNQSAKEYILHNGQQIHDGTYTVEVRTTNFGPMTSDGKAIKFVITCK